MPMTFDGNGTITGLSAGGLPDSSIVTADIANAAITAAKLDGAQNGSAPIYGARAWVNFNGTGTVAIRASGNVSSITDDGTGIYTVNFTTAMPNTNYAVVGAAGESDSGGGNRMLGLRVLATSSVGVRGFSSGSSAVDLPEMCVAIFR
jgi:hypothetical protein